MLIPLLFVWLGWAAFNVMALLFAPWIAGDKAGAFTNGFCIVVPERIKGALNADELAAIYEHERGHKACHHAFKNLARSCLLLPRSKSLAMRQEIEADDYAAARGHGPALASALRKLSTHPFDLHRAQRLEV